MLAVPARSAHADITGYTGSSSVSGWIGNQTDLLPTEVQDPNFGLRYDASVSGQVYGQPLISADGNGHTVLIAVTENNEVYALDANDPGTTYWHAAGLSGTPTAGAASIGAPYVIADDSALKNCIDITPNVGITTTPVVDPSTHTVYFTAKTPDPADSTGATGMYKLHALSLANGAEQSGFPVTISGPADNQSGVSFDPTKELQRPGLLLMNGVVYMGFGGHCDAPTYYGWVIGVGAYSSSNAGIITARWVDQNPGDGDGAGIWMSGSALASDGSGQILLVTGNGTLPQSDPTASTISGTSPPNNLGQSAVRLAVQSNGTLAPTDFFSPKDNASLNSTDLDLGSSGITVLPSQFGSTQHPNIAVLGGKTPVLRTLDLASFGGFDSAANHDLSEVNYGVNGGTGGTWGRIGSWPGDGGWLYVVATAYQVSSGSRLSGLVALQRSVDSSGKVSFVVQGHDPAADGDWIQTSGSPTVSSNGTGSLTAVVWVVQAQTHNASTTYLRAFSAVPDASGNLPLLWSSPAITRGAKFTSVAIDGNHVYIGTRDDTVNTGGTSHIYGYWLSSVPDLSETPYWFGNVATSTSSTITQTLTVRSGASVSITGSSSNDPQHFQVGTPTPGYNSSMAPSSTVQVPVTFTPTTTGDVRSTIALSMSDGSTVTIGVGGTGLAPPPKLVASPTSIDFGNHATTTTTGTQKSFELANAGGQTLTISSNSITPSSVYTVQNMPSNGATIAPGGSLPVSVTYTPTSPTNGTPDTATITVNSSNGGTATVELTGTATPPGVLLVSPLNVDYGDVQVGTASTRSFTVANKGGTTITLSRSKPPGGDFTALTILPESSTLDPGASVTVQVQFRPSVAGSQSATWSFNSDGQGGKQDVILTGNGVLPPGPPPGPAPAPAPGYWMAGADGGIFSFGPGAGYHGSTGSLTLNQPMVALAATPDGGGYWMAAADGGVFAFGDAGWFGAASTLHLNAPIVGMASTPDGRGYWLVARDGGVFAYGTAGYYGGRGGLPLNAPIVGMAATSDGLGYWLVAADGGIFTYGTAQFHGSAGSLPLFRPVVGIAATPDGGGYWLVASDGGVFTYGTALWHGSTGGQILNAPVVGMAPTADGGGYWLGASDGGVFCFGDAPYFGSMGAVRLNRAVVAISS